MNGLILVGGRSRRMGRSKAWICHHGQPQWQYLDRLLSARCDKVFLSGRMDQKSEFLTRGRLAEDRFLVDEWKDIGPLGGLATAFARDAESSWLMVACDMPKLGSEALDRLISSHSPQSPATAAYNDKRACLDPLFSIWEPQAREAVDERVRAARYSPLALLNEMGAHPAPGIPAEWLENANTLQDLLSLGGDS